MKYIICAKDIQDSTTTDPLKRTELCTELIGPRMRALQLLEQGKITCNDIIVTKRDRFCLYENIFSYIMTWEEFENQWTIDNGQLTIIDLVDEVKNGYIDTFQQYEKQFPRKIPFTSSIKLNQFEVADRKFICVLSRGMKNSSEKNIDMEEIVNHFSKEMDLDVFVFGEYPHKVIGDKFYKISGLSSWCALLSNPNCKAVISPCSGGVYPAFFSGHKDLKLIIIDQLHLTEKHANSPSFYHECVNFTGIKKEILFEIPTIEKLKKLI